MGIFSISIIEEMAKEIIDKSDVVCHFYQSAEDVSDSELSSKKKNLMVFEKFSIFQKFRENANFICLFPQDLKNLNNIFEDHVGSDMTKEEFRQLCKVAWEKQLGFVIIDLSGKKHSGKYRSGLDEFYRPI